MLLLEGTIQTFIGRAATTSSRSAASIAPTWMGAISVLTESALGVRMQAESACRVALVPADDFRRLAFSQPAGAPPRDARRSRR